MYSYLINKYNIVMFQLERENLKKEKENNKTV